MSAAHGDHAADNHDTDHHHDFDNEPAKDLSPDEPRTPSWVPILGLALFFLLGTAWIALASSSGGEEAKEPAETKPAAVQAPPEGAKAPAPNPPPIARPAPLPAGSGGLRQIPPDQAREIQKQLEALKQKRDQQPAPAHQ